MLDDNDVLTKPLPLPYDGNVYSVNDLNKFINATIQSDKQPILIGVQIVEFFQAP